MTETLEAFNASIVIIYSKIKIRIDRLKTTRDWLVKNRTL